MCVSVCMLRAGDVLQTVNKHYICERLATNPLPVVPTPDSAAPVDCSTMPAMPQGAVAPVALINAGGPAMCNYFAADNDDSQGVCKNSWIADRYSRMIQKCAHWVGVGLAVHQRTHSPLPLVRKEDNHSLSVMP